MSGKNPFAFVLFALLLTGCSRPEKVTTPATAKTPTVASDVHFSDVTRAAGLNYRWEPPGKRPLNILQTIGNGCAFLDYDRDGNLDILLIGKRPALFRGDGKGHFTDVSAATLNGVQGYFLGVAVGDYDNDGFSDLYLSGYREARLLHNERGNNFADVTAAMGLKPQPWGTSAAWMDLDNDGWLDLYVCNYADFSPETKPQLCKFPTRQHGDVFSSCGPTSYKGLPGVLYQNRKGKLVDVTATLLDRQSGRGLGVAPADIDGSGKLSFAVANDEAPGDLFHRETEGKFQNIAEAAGVARDRNGGMHAGMGLDWGDYNNDGRLDLFVTTFRNQVKNLYRNDGDRLFTDMSYPSGVGRLAYPPVSFGCKFLDADNDGWLDIFIASGHVQDNIELIEDTTYRQKSQLLKGGSDGLFADITEPSGVGAAGAIVGRGLATGDYDNDGKMDVLVVDSEGSPHLLHNEARRQRTADSGQRSGTNWIGFVCREVSGRDAYGVQLRIVLGTQIRVFNCQSAGSYLSASDPRIHIGLGAATKIDTLTVRWPNGKTDAWNDVPGGAYNILTQGKPPQVSALVTGRGSP